MLYKVVNKGVCVEYTRKLRDAQEAFKDSHGETKMFVVNGDGSAKLLNSKR